jgi:hypothetical protein
MCCLTTVADCIGGWGWIRQVQQRSENCKQACKTALGITTYQHAQRYERVESEVRQMQRAVYDLRRCCDREHNN